MAVRYRFRFDPLMFSLFVLFFSLFSALSAWQVTRVFDKQELAERIAFANRADPVRVSGANDAFLLEHLFYRAKASGRFLVDQCFFVENVIKNGKTGLYVYCPFRPAGNTRLLLVNMGWIENEGGRMDLPEYSVPATLLGIEGMINHPRSRPVVMADEQRPDLELANLWAYFDFEYLQRQHDDAFYPVELQLLTEVGTPLVREWQGFDAKIGMHIGYAIHWAAFALVTLGLFLKFNLLKTATND